MRTAGIFILSLVISLQALPQAKTDPWLENLFRKNGSSLLQRILDHPDSFHYQLIYTQIDRDRKNTPHFKDFYLHVNKNDYFNPASTVKLPTALAALEKLHRIAAAGVDKNTSMLTDSSYSGQHPVITDSLSSNGLPSVAQYIKEIFLVSDNDAYNRLYEFVGQRELNEALWQKGYTGSRITRRFMPMNEDENRHTNAIRFIKNKQEIYRQPPAYNSMAFDFSKQYLVGNAYLNRKDSLVNQPMDFTTHNVFLLQDLHRMLRSVIFPPSVPPKQRFALSPDDYHFLYQYMSELPYESRFPHYDTTEFFQSYAKFFMFRAGKQRIPANIRIFNKPGWSYGFLTDAAYIVDFSRHLEFMISACIYTNSDGVINDDKYDYETIGYPFFKEAGELIYQYEITRPRKYLPALTPFRIDYTAQ